MKRNLSKPKAKPKSFGDYHLNPIDSMPLFLAANHTNPRIANHPKVREAIKVAESHIASHEDSVQAALEKAKAQRSRKPNNFVPTRKVNTTLPHLDLYKAMTSGRARDLPDEIIFAHLQKKQLEKEKLNAGEALDTILNAYKRVGFRADAKDALYHLYQFVHTNRNVTAQITNEEREEIAREQKRVSVFKKEHQQLNLSPRALLAHNIQQYIEDFEGASKHKPDDRDALVHGILRTIKALEAREKPKNRF